MRISDSCAACLYDKQCKKTANQDYLAEIKGLLDNRGEDDTSPYIVYLFNKTYEKYFGRTMDYKKVKKTYNDLVLAMENRLRSEIEASDDPLARALVMARIGNYIDFGAMNHVDMDTFMSLFSEKEMREDDRKTYASFLNECAHAEQFLLICDNCGEIVLDKLLIEQLSKRFPRMKFTAMVRGEDVLNDATRADAVDTGIGQQAGIVTNGMPIAGTIYDLLPEDAKKAIDRADVILAKGQGNYESMSGQGMHVFYAFLCKCDLFTSRFQVPRLTGIFIEEKGQDRAI